MREISDFGLAAIKQNENHSSISQLNEKLFENQSSAVQNFSCLRASPSEPHSERQIKVTMLNN